jgi:hypothetical protein
MRIFPSSSVLQDMFELSKGDLDALPFRWEGNAGFAGKVRRGP